MWIMYRQSASSNAAKIFQIALACAPRRLSLRTCCTAPSFDSAAGELLVDGGLNFLSLYGGIITFRILLSWVPQAQGVSLLRPIFTISDVYLNLFRGVIPAIGGLDISPIAAFFVLNLLTNSVASLGAPMSAAQRPRRAARSRAKPGCNTGGRQRTG